MKVLGYATSNELGTPIAGVPVTANDDRDRLVTRQTRYPHNDWSQAPKSEPTHDDMFRCGDRIIFARVTHLPCLRSTD